MKTITSKNRTILFVICMVLVTVVIMEASSRFFWKGMFGIPFFHMNEIIYIYYPNLKAVHKRDIPKDENTFNILLLGGSVLASGWSEIEDLLKEELINKTGKKINIYNVSLQALTSLDSFYKYKYMENKHFDLVVFYHGINETRANNCPPSIFKENYSHYSWYRIINSYERNRPILTFFSLPFTINYITIKLGYRLGVYKFVPRDVPRDSWLECGALVKTKDSFKKNVTGIIKLSESRRQKLLLMSFAYYMPEDYTLEKFRKKQLDYNMHVCRIEDWGLPQNVISGMEAHNKVIRQLTNQNVNVCYVDQHNLIPKNGKVFEDICHFTPKGAGIFVDNITTLIKCEIEDSTLF